MHLLFLKSIPFLMSIIQSSSKHLTYLQVLSFLKNLKFLYIFRLSLLCMNEESWKKAQDIKFYWDSFSNTVTKDKSRDWKMARVPGTGFTGVLCHCMVQEKQKLRLEASKQIWKLLGWELVAFRLPSLPEAFISTQ